MKKRILLAGFAAITLLFTSCVGYGYVSAEPAYIEIGRPPQQNVNQIWIDGDWRWRRQTSSYERRNGHWESPRQGRSYRQGYWESNGKGHHWINGRWE